MSLCKYLVACSLLLPFSSYGKDYPPIEVLQSDNSKQHWVELKPERMSALKKYLIKAIKEDLHISDPLKEEDLYIRITEGGAETRRILFVYAKESSPSKEGDHSDPNSCNYKDNPCKDYPPIGFRLVAVMKVNSEVGSEEPEKLKNLKNLKLPENYFLTAVNIDNGILALPQLIMTKSDISGLGGKPCTTDSEAPVRTCPFSLAIAAQGDTLKEFIRKVKSTAQSDDEKLSRIKGALTTIAAALGKIHKEGVVIDDFDYKNVLYNETSHKAHIIDLGGARSTHDKEEYTANYAPLRETLTDVIGSPLGEKKKCDEFVEEFFRSYEGSFENLDKEFLKRKMESTKSMKCNNNKLK